MVAPLSRQEFRYPRGFNAVLAVLGSAALAAVVAPTVGGPGPVLDRPMPFWLVVAIVAGVTLPALKTAIRPSLIVAWDHHGVELGSGVFVNQVRRIPWASVRRVEKGTIRVNIHSSRPAGQEARRPALRLVFDRSVRLGSRGFNVSEPDPPHGWLIADSVFPRSLDTIVRELEERVGR